MGYMAVVTYVCGSCAVASLNNIGSQKDSKEVLAIFCRSELGKTDNPFQKPGKRHLTNFYIFCAGPEVKSDEKGGTGHSKNHWPKYGTEFAAYLKRNKLGKVVTVGPKLNLKHHPTSTAQLWAWSPNQKAVEAWWKKYEAGELD
jgi:hypothetical protein